MSSIPLSGLHLFIGQRVRIVYGDRSVLPTTSGTPASVDDRITPPVELLAYDPVSKQVTFRRTPGGPSESIVPKDVFAVTWVSAE